MQPSPVRANASSISLSPAPVTHQNIHGDLQPVFDVGMNNGDDSAYYLSRGCRVIAVEANPVLAELARERFRTEIASGQMVLEAVGIVDRPGKIPFWINEERSVFSSFDRAKAVRDGMKCHPVEVACVTFDMLLKRHGVPDYLKLDVEGAEPHCLRSLQGFGLPSYLSVEAESLEYLLLLWNLGYRQFKISPQLMVSRFHKREYLVALGEARMPVCGPLQEQNGESQFSSRLLGPTRRRCKRKLANERGSGL